MLLPAHASNAPASCCHPTLFAAGLHVSQCEAPSLAVRPHTLPATCSAGSVGGTYATPLVNPPESAIVALGKLRAVPMFGGASGSEVVRRHVMCVSWGADHRVVDGATLAAASNVVKALLEEPARLLLHLR